MRKKIIVGNWKMYKTNTEAMKFIEDIEKLYAQKHTDVIAGLAVPFTALSVVRKHSQNIVIVAQNVHFEKEGAYTGEVSIPMLQDIKVEYALVGHSERREMFGETDETVNKKLKALLKAGMTPILCCGESLTVFEAQQTNSFVEDQIAKAFAGIAPTDAAKVVIAYEPIWAIGTGKVATPEIAESVCKIIRTKVASLYDQSVADQILIQYGGSVKPETIKELLNQPNIDGALVGGASLVLESYLALINYQK